MESIHINTNDKILIVAPHPDDECIGVGGLLYKFAEKCSVLVLTDGSLGQNNISANECKKIRRDELIREMKYLRIDKYFFKNIPDGSLMNNLYCLEDIDLKMYTKIFVTSDGDGHADHVAAYICVRNALKKQNNPNIELYTYEVHKMMSSPSHYLDITEEIDSKIKLVQFHESQIERMPYDIYVRVNSEYRALQNRQKNSFWEVYTKIDNDIIYDLEKMQLEKDLQKFKMFYQLLTIWIEKSDTELEKFLIGHHINNCVIYGYAELGKILRNKLNKLDIEIKYIMDKKIKVDPKKELMFYYPQKDLDKPDAVIVTAVYCHEEIKEELRRLGFSNIYSLYEIVTNM